MSKYDYLLKQGWTLDEAKKYIESQERGSTPSEAYKTLRDKGISPKEAVHQVKLESPKYTKQFHKPEKEDTRPYTERVELEAKYLKPGKYEPKTSDMDKFVSQYHGKERKEIEAKLKGYRSEAERKEIVSRVYAGSISEAEKRYREENYDPEEVYHTDVGEVKRKIYLTKENIKKLATPAGAAGALILAIKPQKTLKEKIETQREKIRAQESAAKYRELKETRAFELEKAALYGGYYKPGKGGKYTYVPLRKGQRPPLSTKPRKFLGGFGGLTTATPRGTTQRRVERRVEVRQPQTGNPFGLDEGGIARTERPVRTERIPERKVEYRPIRYNPVNDPSSHGLVDMGAPRRQISQPQRVVRETNPVGNFGFGNVQNPVNINFGNISNQKNANIKKKSISTDPTGASAYY